MVQDRLKEGANEQGLKRKLNSEYLLTGKLFCGECGAPMMGVSGTGRNGELHYYYTCKAKRVDGKCNKENIQREFLEQLVVDMTRACITNAELVDWLVKGYIEIKKQARENSEVPLMERELKDKKKALANLLKAVENGIYNDTTAERMKELEEEVKVLERSLELGKMMFDESVDGERLTFYLHKLSEGHPDKMKYRKELFRTFVRRVTLWDNRIEVEYNFTGTDDNDGSPYKVVKEFLQADDAGSVPVRPESAKSHQTVKIRTIWFGFLLFVLQRGLKTDVFRPVLYVSEQIQHTIQINCLSDMELVLWFYHVVEQKLQNQGTAEAAALDFEVGKAHGQVDITDVINADKARIFHSLGEAIALAAARSIAMVLRAVFTEIPAADILIAGLSVHTAKPTALIAEKLHLVFLCLGQSAPLIEALIQPKVRHSVLEVIPVHLVHKLLEIREHLCGGGHEIELWVSFFQVFQQQIRMDNDAIPPLFIKKGAEAVAGFVCKMLFPQERVAEGQPG